LPYFFDVLDYKKISNEKLKKEIDNYGKIFYLKGWLETTLGEVMEIKNEKLKMKNLTLDNYISTENLLPDRLGVQKSANLPNIPSVNAFKKDDTLFSNIRTYFKKVWFAKFDGGASNDVLIFTPKDESKLDKKFLYYFISSDRFIDFTVISAKGTKMPRGDKEAMKTFSISLPPLPEQIAIASVLSAFDDKIELLREQNKTLEEMGQVIFAEMCLPPNPLVGGTEQVISKEMCLPPNPLIGGTEEDDSLKEEIEQVVFAEMCLPPLIGGTEEDNSLKEEIEQDKKYENWKLNLSQEEVKEKGLIWDGKHFPYNPNNLEKAKMMRRNPTQAEKKLWDEFLSRHDYKFYRQRPIDHFIADFYCSKADLIIEVDGDVHLSDASKEYDRMRTELFNTYGLKVIRFSNEEVINSFKNVCQKINEYLKPFNLQKAPFQEVEVVQNFPEKELEIVQTPPVRGLGGNLPEGWRVGKLGEICEITSGKRPENISETKTETHQIPLLGATKIMGFVENYLFDGKTLIIGRVGTHGEVQRFNEKIFPSDNTLVVKSDNFVFVYQILKSIDYAKMNRGAVQPLITQTDLKNYEIIIPSNEVLQSFKEITNRIFEKIYDNSEQIQSLSKFRDELLPRLMRGEVQVSKP
jgi:restriction endonuclease S subunit/very-short-patch-repair endonuclease